VSDKGTADLMSRLYKGMLREGLRPTAALRAAQLELRGQKQWRAPYYWAGFVQQGEWR
jgi:CHAT domain-containing protein